MFTETKLLYKQRKIYILQNKDIKQSNLLFLKGFLLSQHILKTLE
jgi:hypothetical protein